MILKDLANYGSRMPNLCQDTEMLSIHCDLVNTSLVDGVHTDIIDHKAEEKSGDLMIKRLRGVKNKNTPTTIPTRKEEECTDMMRNRLISGEGLLLGKKARSNQFQYLDKYSKFLSTPLL